MCLPETKASTEVDALQRVADDHAFTIKQRLEEIDSALESGDIEHAEKSAEPFKSESSPWIAEWVLMTKARKLQATKLPAAIQVAKLNTRLYPQSFSAFYLLADLLFQDRSLNARRCGQPCAAAAQFQIEIKAKPPDPEHLLKLLRHSDARVRT